MEVSQNIKNYKKDLEDILSEIKTSITDAHKNKISFDELKNLQNEQKNLMNKFPNKKFTLKRKRGIIPTKEYNPIPLSKEWLNYFTDNLPKVNSIDLKNQGIITNIPNINNNSSNVISENSSDVNNSEIENYNKIQNTNEIKASNDKKISNKNENNDETSIVESNESSNMNLSLENANEVKDNTSLVETDNSSSNIASLTNQQLVYYGIPPNMVKPQINNKQPVIQNPDPIKFNIMSFNVYDNMCLKNDKTRFDNILKNKDIKIIFTQENPKKNLLKFDGYDEIDLNGKDGEIVGVYSKSEFPAKILNKIESTKVNPERYAIISESNGIKIANLHLSGGRYVDQDFVSLLKSNNNNKINKFIEDKLELLELVIKENPDVILGDFNSVYAYDINRRKEFLEIQYKYFESLSIKGKNKFIEKYNLTPYNLLENKNYIYSKPINEDTMVTSLLGNTIVDTIWYRNNKIELINTEILDYDSNQSGGTKTDNIIYTAAFLTNKGKKDLTDYLNTKFKGKFTKGQGKQPNDRLHMTLYFNKDKKSNKELKNLKENSKFKVGQKIKLKVLGYKETDKLQVVKIEYEDLKGNAHITLSVNNGAKPSEAINLINNNKTKLQVIKDCPELEAIYGFKVQNNKEIEYKKNLFEITDDKNKSSKEQKQPKTETSKIPNMVNKSKMLDDCAKGEISSDHYPVMTTIKIKVSDLNYNNTNNDSDSSDLKLPRFNNNNSSNTSINNKLPELKMNSLTDKSLNSNNFKIKEFKNNLSMDSFSDKSLKEKGFKNSLSSVDSNISDEKKNINNSISISENSKNDKDEKKENSKNNSNVSTSINNNNKSKNEKEFNKKELNKKELNKKELNKKELNNFDLDEKKNNDNQEFNILKKTNKSPKSEDYLSSINTTDYKKYSGKKISDIPIENELENNKLNNNKLINDNKLNNNKLNDNKLNDNKLNNNKLNDNKLNNNKLKNDNKSKDNKLNDNINENQKIVEEVKKEEVDNNKEKENKQEINNNMKNNTSFGIENKDKPKSEVNNNKKEDINQSEIKIQSNNKGNEDLNTTSKIEKIMEDDPNKSCEFDDVTYYHKEGDKTILLDNNKERINYIVIDKYKVNIKNIDSEVIQLFTKVLDPLERKDVIRLRRKMDYEKEDIELEIINEDKNKTVKKVRENKKKSRKSRTMKNHYLMHIVPKREMRNTSIIKKKIKKEIMKNNIPNIPKNKLKKIKKETSFEKKYKPKKIRKSKVDRREKKLKEILINNHQFHKLKKM